MNIDKLNSIKNEYLLTKPVFGAPSSVHPKEQRVVLKNFQVINPESIFDYIAKDGYQAIAKTLTMTQIDVINEVIDSGLRGRGGVGFPAGLKWKFTLGYASKEKYVICNADEGEPGTFMDRYILEGDPHQQIEGMMIAGYAIGANKGYVYLRKEYPLANVRLQKAIDDAKEMGILGKKIFDTEFAFDIEIRIGAGSFICGEETALMESIEGKRGLSRNKPPFPAEIGLFNKPTVINNVETLACIPDIMLKGSKWFKSIGTPKSSGTKIFSLSGKVKNPGIFEVPLGIKVGEIIHDLGQGMKPGSDLKAIFFGGPSGGVLTPEHLDLVVDFDSLNDYGATMGSGGVIVLDQNDCVMDVIKLFIEFNKDESCGKCTPCREGTSILFEMIENITEGKSSIDELENLKHLSKMVQTTSLCGLGQAAPDPILSVLRYFEDEFMEHLVDHKCKANVCDMSHTKGGQ